MSDDKVMSETGPRLLIGRELIRRLVDVGVVSERATRVIIDADVDGAVIVHVQEIGDSRLLDVLTPADRVEIRNAFGEVIYRAGHDDLRPVDDLADAAYDAATRDVVG